MVCALQIKVTWLLIEAEHVAVCLDLTITHDSRLCTCEAAARAWSA
jgi:hypothetical protein